MSGVLQGKGMKKQSGWTYGVGSREKSSGLIRKTETKKTDSAVAKNNMPARVEGKKKAKVNWLGRNTKIVMHIGLGRSVKHMDESFDYN